MKFTVLSVYPHQISSQFDYGRFTIPAPAIDAEFSMLSIEDFMTQGGFGAGFSKVAAGWDDERGEPKFFRRPISAEEIAQNIAREWEHAGVVVLKGESPTQDELATAQNNLVAFYARQVKEADENWVRFREQPGMVSDLMREAGRYLTKIGHPAMAEPRRWMVLSVEAVPTADCPVCGERIKKDVIKCKHCGAILKPEEAAKFGIFVPPPPQEPTTVGAGESEPKKRR